MYKAKTENDKIAGVNDTCCLISRKVQDLQLISIARHVSSHEKDTNETIHNLKTSLYETYGR
jgi:hypothetical protein